MAMEWFGTFEVPGSETRVGGRLTIEGRRSILTTFGALVSDGGSRLESFFSNGEADDTIPIVWGVSETGDRLTLLDLVYLDENLHSPGEWTTQQRWICQCAIGQHIEPEDPDEPVGFSSISFGLSDLSAWLGAPEPRRDWALNPSRLDLSVETHELGEVDHEDLTIRFDGSFGARSSFESVTVSYPARATATSSVEKPWHQLVNEVVTPIEVLLWVATGRFSALDDLRVRLEGEHPQYVPLWASLLQPRDFEPPTRRMLPHEMLFTAADVPGGLGAGVSRWFEKWADIRPAFGPVIARYRAPFSYANDRFHSAVAALESYSTWKHGKRAMERIERNRRIDLVRKVLDVSEPDLTDWVLEALDRAHHHTLRTRLQLLLDEAGPIAEALIGDSVAAFVASVVKARDSHAHSAPIVGRIDGGTALHWAAQGLNWLLRYHALIEIGFDDEQARERVLSNGRFGQEAERLKGVLQAQDES